MLWTSVYNIVIPGQDNGDFVAPAASKTLAFYYFANGDYSLDKERWSLEMKFKQNLTLFWTGSGITLLDGGGHYGPDGF